MGSLATESARAARAARRRLMLADFVGLAGAALLWGSAAAAALVAADRLGFTIAPLLVSVLAPLSLAVLAAVVVAIARRPTLGASAARLDRSLGLRDRVSTALALPRTEDPFSQWARAEGERVAREADASKAAPVRTDWTWGAWPVVMAACVAGAVFAPRVDWKSGRKTEHRATTAERTAAADRLAAAAGTARAETAAVEEASGDDLAAIQALEADLRAGEGDPAQAVTRAAGRMESMARDLEQRAATSARAADAVRDRLAAAGAPRQEEASSESSATLRGALSRGDVPAAEAAAEELAKAADQMSETDRLALAQDLEKLASGLKPGPANAELDAATRALQENGVAPDLAEQIASETDTQRMQEELQKHGVDPEAAHRAAERANEAREQQKSEQDAQRQMQELGEALKDAAEAVRNGEKTTPEPPRGKPEEPSKSDGSQSQERRPPSGNDQQKSEENGGERQPGSNQKSSEKSQRQEPGAGEKPESGQDKQRQSEPGQGEARQGESKPGDSKQGEPKQGQPRPGESPSPSSGSQPKGEPQQGAGEQKTNEPKPGDSGRPASSGKEPQQAPGERDGTQERPQAQPAPGGGAQKGGEKQPANGEGAQPGEPPSQDRPGEQEGAERAARPESKPGKQGTGHEKPDQPGASPQGDKPGGMRGLQRRLRDMAQQRDAARDLQERAQRLRDASRELMRQPGDGTGNNPEWGRGVGNSERPTFAPASQPRPLAAHDVPVDARPATAPDSQPREHVIAEWYSPGRSNPAPASAMATDLRTAARGAERAVEQQSVPARHSDLVRRVFRRYAERAEPP